jgi:hypothetical protein
MKAFTAQHKHRSTLLRQQEAEAATAEARPHGQTPQLVMPADLAKLNAHSSQLVNIHGKQAASLCYSVEHRNMPKLYTHLRQHPRWVQCNRLLQATITKRSFPPPITQHNSAVTSYSHSDATARAQQVLM